MVGTLMWAMEGLGIGRGDEIFIANAVGAVLPLRGGAT